MYNFESNGISFEFENINDLAYEINCCYYSNKRHIYNDLLWFGIEEFGEDNIYRALKDLNLFYKRKVRLKHKIEDNFINENGCLFLTMTFDNKKVDYESLLNDLPRTKNQIRRFLNKLNCYWICNVDYGGKNDRLHFHALINSNYIDCNLYKYGNIDVRRVYFKENDSTCLTRYIMKLTNHGVKASVKGNKVMYSRKRFLRQEKVGDTKS